MAFNKWYVAYSITKFFVWVKTAFIADYSDFYFLYGFCEALKLTDWNQRNEEI